jgi:hypothetical protein
MVSERASAIANSEPTEMEGRNGPPHIVLTKNYEIEFADNTYQDLRIAQSGRSIYIKHPISGVR